MGEEGMISVDLSIHDENNEEVELVTLGWFKYRRDAQALFDALEKRTPEIYASLPPVSRTPSDAGGAAISSSLGGQHPQHGAEGR